MKYIYLRDDDVYKCDKNFKRIFATLKEYKIPVIYGVIPKLATKNFAHFLNKEKTKNPSLIDISQHGWKHTNYGGKTRNKYEFGHLRSITQQGKDILKGYLKMKKLFGKNFTPAFIPPYHGYNKNTLKIIDELKIPIFSANKKTTIKKKKFLDLPIDIVLNDYNKKSRPVTLKSEIMIKRLLASLNCKGNTKGILLHHNTITTDNDFKEIKVFLLFLRKMATKKIIKLAIFSNFLKRSPLRS